MAPPVIFGPMSRASFRLHHGTGSPCPIIRFRSFAKRWTAAPPVIFGPMNRASFRLHHGAGNPCPIIRFRSFAKCVEAGGAKARVDVPPAALDEDIIVWLEVERVAPILVGTWIGTPVVIWLVSSCTLCPFTGRPCSVQCSCNYFFESKQMSL